MDYLYRIDRNGVIDHVVCQKNSWRLVEGNIYKDYSLGEEISESGFKILSPIEPSKIVAVGLNYRDHAAEVNKVLPEEPLIFIKPSTAVIGPGADIVVPAGVGRVDYEAELAIVIGRPAYRVRAQEAGDYILGLTSMNDVTARDLQKHDVQYTRCKGFDTFAPIGPCVAIGLEASALNVESLVNGELRQSSNTRELIFDTNTLVEFVSSVMTLLPGDLISTGTPSGIGPLSPGDQVVVRVEGVGELVNGVSGVS